MKSEIIQTSLQQFLKHGIREMSIQKLIEPLGISTKTVYKYFKNKEELLEEALNLYFRQQYETMTTYPADQSGASHFFDLWRVAVETEHKVNKAFFQDLYYYYPELGQKIDRAVAKKFSEQFLLVIKKGINDGTFRQEIIPEVVLESIYVLYTAIIRIEHFKGFRLSQNELMLNTITPVIRGICTEKGVKELDKHIQNLKTSGNGKVTKGKISA
jgi:TetR/AcrR family transcriptional regulator, cholesterol catabolism regulator